MKKIILTIVITSLLIACNSNEDKIVEQPKVDQTSGATKKSTIHYPEETHIKNVKQITFGGDNAEAYFSFDNQQLVVQIKNEAWGIACDQIFLLNVDSTYKHSRPKMISTGKGKTTCSYFLKGDTTFVYSSTHLADVNCPPSAQKRADGKYVWPIYASFDIFVADLNGKILQQLTNTPGYDAEPTVSPKGDKIVFTSIRTGDLELFTMNIDGSEVKQITSGLGYDGGAFFSPNGEKIIFRASRPKTEEAIKNYKQLLAEGLVQPTEMELFTCNVDGSDLKQLTNLGGANWAPFFHPSGKKILFSSNHTSKKGYPFNLFLINLDGTGLEQVTYDGVFDAFPMFSSDGKKLVFSSNRNNGGNHDTNLFIAEWED